MKISGEDKSSLSSLMVTSTGQMVVSPVTSVRSVSSTTNSSDDYQASDVAQWLEEAGAALDDSSDIDMARVDSIRQALSEGQLSLDPQALSQAILEMHRG